MYYIYGSVRAIPTYRVYRLHDYDFDGAFSYVYMQRSLCMDAQEKIFDCNIQWNKCERKNNIVNIQLIFMVAIRLLMFSAGIGGGESKSMRLAGGVSVDLLMVDGPGAPFWPVGGESAEVLSPAEVPPWAEVWDDDTEEPVSELLPAFFLLLRLRLRPLLGYSFV